MYNRYYTGRSTFYLRSPDLADFHTHNLRTDRIDFGKS